jgi:hypothetical protein
MIIELKNAKCYIDKHIQMDLIEELVGLDKNYYFKLKCPAKYQIVNDCTLINHVIIKIPSIIDIENVLFEITETPTLKYKNLEIHTDYVNAIVNIVDGYYWIQFETTKTYTDNTIYINEFIIKVEPSTVIDNMDTVEKTCGEAGLLMHIKG